MKRGPKPKSLEGHEAAKRLGLWLRAKRTARGLSIEEAAMRIGVTKQRWHQLERGRSWPRNKTLLRLATALNCSEDEIFAAAAGYQKEAEIKQREKNESVATSTSLSQATESDRRNENKEEELLNHYRWLSANDVPPMPKRYVHQGPFRFGINCSAPSKPVEEVLKEIGAGYHLLPDKRRVAGVVLGEKAIWRLHEQGITLVLRPGPDENSLFLDAMTHEQWKILHW